MASAAWLAKFKQLPERDQKYAALIAEADEAIGAVMAKLRELKLVEDTLVFVISDNGGAAAQGQQSADRRRTADGQAGLSA